MKSLTLSIVIPVYNEQDHLRACLEAIASQTELPDEVIIVDNNSQDDSAVIAQSFGFVRVITEKQQGIVHARNAGFDAAKSDIIGRIDADTIISENWVETVKAAFAHEPQTAAITGDCFFYDFPARRLTKTIHHAVYYSAQKLILRNQMLWGSNMAIRRSAWNSVKNACTDDTKEDIDLSIQLAKHNMSATRIPSLLAYVSMRRGNLDPKSAYEYLRPWPETYRRNGMKVRAVLIHGLLFGVLAFVLPVATGMQLAQYIRKVAEPSFSESD